MSGSNGQQFEKGLLAGCIRFAYFFSFGVPLLTRTYNTDIVECMLKAQPEPVQDQPEGQAMRLAGDLTLGYRAQPTSRSTVSKDMRPRVRPLITPPIRTRHTQTREYINFSVLLVSSMQVQAQQLYVWLKLPKEYYFGRDEDTVARLRHRDKPAYAPLLEEHRKKLYANGRHVQTKSIM